MNTFCEKYTDLHVGVVVHGEGEQSRERPDRRRHVAAVSI